MKIIDTHTHLDEINFENSFDAINFLSSETTKCGFYKSFVLLLLVQKWSREEIGELIGKSGKVLDAPTTRYGQAGVKIWRVGDRPPAKSNFLGNGLCFHSSYLLML